MRASRRLLLLLMLSGPLLGLLPRPAGADATLYDRLGGRSGVERIVQEAVALYLTDPRLKDDFDNINPDYLRPRLVDFVCRIADGPCVYKGRSMAASHKGLHITEARFDAVVEDLQIAMNRAGVPFWTQNQLLARLAPMERDIVTK